MISQTPSGYQALARFQNAADARAAVQTLHGFDMRSAAEKAAKGHQAPEESDCFSLRIDEGTGKSMRKRKLKANGIFIWPLPESWAEKDYNRIKGHWWNPSSSIYIILILHRRANAGRGAFGGALWHGPEDQDRGHG